MKYRVVLESSVTHPIQKKTFRNKRDAESYAERVSKHWRGTVKVERVGTAPPVESLQYRRDRSLYDTLCNGDPTFKDRISFEDFRAGKLTEKNSESEERTAGKNSEPC
jgi:hypothetical protein